LWWHPSWISCLHETHTVNGHKYPSPSIVRYILHSTLIIIASFLKIFYYFVLMGNTRCTAPQNKLNTEPYRKIFYYYSNLIHLTASWARRFLGWSSANSCKFTNSCLSENLRIDLYHLYHALLGRFMQVCSSSYHL
jgi:hypothetical protein